MQQHRTVISGTRDGSILVVREARFGVSGGANDRRKQRRAGIVETWRTVDRVITRSLDNLPAKAKAWFSTSTVVPELERTTRNVLKFCGFIRAVQFVAARQRIGVKEAAKYVNELRAVDVLSRKEIAAIFQVPVHFLPKFPAANAFMQMASAVTGLSEKELLDAAMQPELRAETLLKIDANARRTMRPESFFAGLPLGV